MIVLMTMIQYLTLVRSGNQTKWRKIQYEKCLGFKKDILQAIEESTTLYQCPNI